MSSIKAGDDIGRARRFASRLSVDLGAKVLDFENSRAQMAT
jgi:hypothetical protein